MPCYPVGGVLCFPLPGANILCVGANHTFLTQAVSILGCLISLVTTDYFYGRQSRFCLGGVLRIKHSFGKAESLVSEQSVFLRHGMFFMWGSADIVTFFLSLFVSFRVREAVYHFPSHMRATSVSKAWTLNPRPANNIFRTCGFKCDTIRFCRFLFSAREKWGLPRVFLIFDF
jgi:hypothetical protein